MNRDDIIRMAREQGLPETEIEGVFRVNTDDLGRMLAADNTEQMLIDAMRSTMAVAWGYLWHITTDDMRVNGARKLLLEMIEASGISSEEFRKTKKYGITEAKKDGCRVRVSEIESFAAWGEG